MCKGLRNFCLAHYSERPCQKKIGHFRIRLVVEGAFSFSASIPSWVIFFYPVVNVLHPGFRGVLCRNYVNKMNEIECFIPGNENLVNFGATVESPMWAMKIFRTDQVNTECIVIKS